VLPDTSPAEIEAVTEDPATTDLLPSLAREKLKGWVMVNEALASALAVYPVLKAFALIWVLLVKVMGPL
jgi:hypothetical protein